MALRSLWRRRARPIIQKVLIETRDKTEKEIHKALIEAYPFGEKKYHPYKIWLDEIKSQRGKKKTKLMKQVLVLENAGQAKLEL